MHATVNENFLPAFLVPFFENGEKNCQFWNKIRHRIIISEILAFMNGKWVYIFNSVKIQSSQEYVRNIKFIKITILISKLLDLKKDDKVFNFNKESILIWILS